MVVTDPYHQAVGFTLPQLSADIVTVSHQHPDHNESGKIKGTSRRSKPFVVEAAGEYEVGGISVFGVQVFHDASGGVERGQSVIFTIMLDGVRVCHLGDLGHELTQEQIGAIGSVDVLLCPVGGVFTIAPEQAVTVIKALEPGIVIPMHYRTPEHDSKVYGELNTLEDFSKAYGGEIKPESKISVEANRLPEETELVTLVTS